MKTTTLALCVACLSAPAAADTILVTQVNLTFQPQDIQICVGDTVQWNWTMGTHTVTEGQDASIDGTELFDEPLDSANQTVSVTFDAAFLAANPMTGNVYDYVCTFHFIPGLIEMQGSVTVDPGPTIYCTPKASSVGCLALIGTSDSCSPVSGAADYFVEASGVHSFKSGLVFAGVTGPAAIPFSGGLLCVNPPNKRGPVINSGGSGPNNCTGAFSQLVNDGVLIPAGLDVGAGSTGWYQFWYRDPANGAGSLGTALSDGVQLDFL